MSEELGGGEAIAVCNTACHSSAFGPSRNLRRVENLERKRFWMELVRIREDLRGSRCVTDSRTRNGGDRKSIKSGSTDAGRHVALALMESRLRTACASIPSTINVHGP
jgi:hypothetical protein